MYAWLLLASVPVLWQAHRLLTWGRHGLQDGAGGGGQVSPAPDINEQVSQALYANADVIINIDQKSPGTVLALQLGVRLGDVLGAIEGPGGLLTQLVADPGLELFGRDKELTQAEAESARRATQWLLLREGHNSSTVSSSTNTLGNSQTGQTTHPTMAMLAELGTDAMARRAVQATTLAQRRHQQQGSGSTPWGTSPNVRVKLLQPGPTAAETHALRIQVNFLEGQAHVVQETSLCLCSRAHLPKHMVQSNSSTLLQ
jgi:hypothetical protein